MHTPLDVPWMPGVISWPCEEQQWDPVPAPSFSFPCHMRTMWQQWCPPWSGTLCSESQCPPLLATNTPNHLHADYAGFLDVVSWTSCAMSPQGCWCWCAGNPNIAEHEKKIWWLAFHGGDLLELVPDTHISQYLSKIECPFLHFFRGHPCFQVVDHPLACWEGHCEGVPLLYSLYICFGDPDLFQW